MSFRASKLIAGLLLLSALSAGSVSLQGATAPAMVALSSAPNGPALFPHLPPAGKATGAAMVIVPALDSEAAQMAKWLNDRGVAAFVLRWKSAADIPPAVRTLRAKAADYAISPTRIAVVGFAKGAEAAAEAAYEIPAEARPDATEPTERFSGQPNLLGLIWGAKVPASGPAANSPTTFIVGSTAMADSQGSTIDLWTKLRSTRVPVDAHFFQKGSPTAGLALNDPALGSWPDMFYAWIRFNGFLTDEVRVPLKGMVYVDGQAIPHGYMILSPVDFTGAGPIVARVFNSTANETIGSFSVPAKQGPIPGRYKVDVRLNMNRWLSNSFSGGLVGGRGAPSPEAVHFGHHRPLAPSIEDQRSFTKVRPGDAQDYIIEIKPGDAANQEMKIEVFTK